MNPSENCREAQTIEELGIAAQRYAEAFFPSDRQQSTEAA